jgi:drug/metabolite transporter (DMT)-like permease
VTPPPFPLAGELCAVASSALWAVAGVLFVRVRGVSGVAMNLGKNLAAVVCFLLLLTALKGVPWPAGVSGEGLLLLTLSGVVGLTVCDTLLFRAFLEIGPRRGNVFMTLAPVLTAVAALFPPFGEHPPALAWLGIAVCLSGVLLALLERSLDPVRQAQLKRGARDALLAACFQALGLLLARRGFQAAGIDVASGSAVRLVAGTAGLLVVGLATRRLAGWTRQLARDGAWWRIGLAAVLGTFLGIWSNQAGLAWAAHTGVAATLNSLAPVFLIPLSTLFLGERHDARAWASTILAVGGIALLMLR